MQQTDESTGQGFSMYRELFSDDYLYLTLEGFPFEVASSAGLTGNGPATIVVRLTDEWAKKLGLLKE
jgi:hypothetical protein